MRVLTIILFLPFIFLTACKQNNDQKIFVEEYNLSESTSRSEFPQENEQTQKRERKVYFNPEIIDTTAFAYLEFLRKEYASVPFYIRLDLTDFYVVSNQEFEYYNDVFDGSKLFGLIEGGGKKLLDLKYDKIYNPEVTVLDCFEFKEKGKIGLINFKNMNILEAQFDYIVSADPTPTHKAVGVKNQQAYLIDASTFQLTAIDTFSLSKRLEEYAFDIKEVEDQLYYNVDYLLGGDKVGVFLINSFMERFNDNPEFNEYHYSFSIEDGRGYVESWSVNSTSVYNLANDIVSFFIDFYSYGVSGRPYYVETRQLVSLDEKSLTVESGFLNNKVEYNPFCRYVSERKVNDSIFEARYNAQLLGGNNRNYYWEPSYRYLKIGSNGQIETLKTDRFYSFTKFIVINESYFEVCLANFFSAEDTQVEYFEHYSIEDLDIMRNEIFAEYGLRFKSEKWQQYFKQKSWYKPKYDNVDHLLTEIDKKNLQVILKRRKEMEADEKKFRQRHLAIYHAVG